MLEYRYARLDSRVILGQCLGPERRFGSRCEGQLHLERFRDHAQQLHRFLSQEASRNLKAVQEDSLYRLS